jgi:DNA-binding IclR family transcriptional regulator
MGVAAPIHDFSGSVVGVLSLGFPATRETDVEFVDGAIRDLKQAAAEASANLGYSGAPEDSESVETPEA